MRTQETKKLRKKKEVWHEKTLRPPEMLSPPHGSLYPHTQLHTRARRDNNDIYIYIEALLRARAQLGCAPSVARWKTEEAHRPRSSSK